MDYFDVIEAELCKHFGMTTQQVGELPLKVVSTLFWSIDTNNRRCGAELGILTREEAGFSPIDI